MGFLPEPNAALDCNALTCSQNRRLFRPSAAKWRARYQENKALKPKISFRLIIQGGFLFRIGQQRRAPQPARNKGKRCHISIQRYAKTETIFAEQQNFSANRKQSTIGKPESASIGAKLYSNWGDTNGCNDLTAWVAPTH